MIYDSLRENFGSADAVIDAMLGLVAYRERWKCTIENRRNDESTPVDVAVIADDDAVVLALLGLGRWLVRAAKHVVELAETATPTEDAASEVPTQLGPSFPRDLAR